jgi:hypothetical protein
MRNMAKTAFVGILLVTSAVAGLGQSRGSLVVVLKDGHRQSFSVAEITRIEFKAKDIVVFKSGGQQSFPLADVQSFDFDTSAATSFAPGRNHFLGRWKVGVGGGSAGIQGHFYITLKPDGEAVKTLGAPHGAWTVVEGEARITWDDGWRDVIRRAGTGHEKVAHEPGTSFSDASTYVADAVRVEARPI